MATAAPLTTAAPTTTTKPTTSTRKPTTTSTTSTSTTTTLPGTDPGTLPQTSDKPTPAGVLFDSDARGFWNAIVTGVPDPGMPFFFPLAAYLQVKNIPDPAGDYQTRLVADYERDIHALHNQLGADTATAQYVKIVVPNTAQWIKPGVEYNKGAYWRVYDSTLVYTVDGRQHSLPIKSMISWRGQWYVVHLSAIQ